jgi:hypothetical protein
LLLLELPLLQEVKLLLLLGLHQCPRLHCRRVLAVQARWRETLAGAAPRVVLHFRARALFYRRSGVAEGRYAISNLVLQPHCLILNKYNHHTNLMWLRYSHSFLSFLISPSSKFQVRYLNLN